MIAIDPGNEQSAWVIYENGKVYGAAIELNDDVLRRIECEWGTEQYVIEMIASYGMPVGREVFETCVWIGRFMEAAGGAEWVYRKDVKMHLCQSPRAKDANIRQALIDRFGPGKDKAIGKKASPGPLYGFKADMWQALAVAVTYEEMERRSVA
ncbi:hypothetical protein CAI21_21685 [Alkalilimnicola ehrlichii]|uniref:Uncharacterized protein n=1 Tax=Alkalilimnicola ehrlichii TaxID=351052 RepID=A0A3E0WQB4_9GAMM|nr:hypothetical protein [Alkalilimnicola ehrlichii]RFA24437.1 hypothetical protein CAI21_21685 [Alkalilimnicola ehrlichii]RFA35152.1 hypothetical protein CAL65_13690 [Alkalilimnicola ehrlichii]